MSTNNTTLAVALAADSLKAVLTSATGVEVDAILKINDEYMFVDGSYVSGTTVPLRQRGFYGTRAKAHSILAPVTVMTDPSEIGDFPTDSEDSDWEQVSIGANGTIAVPTKNTVVIMNKATALASTTLADPDDAQDGLTIKLICGTNAAHVVTTTTVYDGTTGAHTTLTFAAFIGASLTLRAHAGAWHVIANNACTIT